MQNLKYEDIKTLVIEECAELIQVLTKIDRFGIDNFHPETKKTNYESLVEESGDLCAVLFLLEKFFQSINKNHETLIEERMAYKIEKLAKMMKTKEGE